MFEHHSAPLAPRTVFLARMFRHALFFVGGVVGALAVGMFGYWWTEGMSFVDAFLNAAMILGGMGPVAELHTDAGKYFAGIYAILAGGVFLVLVGVVLAPWAHRVLHRLHIETEKDAQE